MENKPTEGLSEIQALYENLSPLDRSREVYLFATLFREELGMRSPWDVQTEGARRDYARTMGNSLNDVIYQAELIEDVSSVDIEDFIVRFVSTETQHRWLVYTERIEANGKEEIFIEQLRRETSVTCSLEEKTEEIRNSWKKFVDEYGTDGAEFNPTIRAEFISNKTIWDTAKEGIFLRQIMSFGPDQAAA